MASGKTPLRNRPYPFETDAPDVAADIKSLALSVDTTPTATVGTLAERPTPSAAGNRHLVQGDSTEANNGIEWVDTGSAWVVAVPESESVLSSMLKALAVTTAKIAEGAVTAAKLAASAVTTEKIADEAVTGAKLGEGTVRLLAGATYSTSEAREAEVQYEASATRPALVVVHATTGKENEKVAMTVTIHQGTPGIVINGNTGGAVAGHTCSVTVTFICPAGVKWSCNVQHEGEGATPVPASSYLLL